MQLMLVSKYRLILFLQRLFHRFNVNQPGSLSDMELQKALEAAGDAVNQCI